MIVLYDYDILLYLKSTDIYIFLITEMFTFIMFVYTWIILQAVLGSIRIISYIQKVKICR